MAGRWQRDRGKEQFWRRILRQWRRSGLGVRPFCALHQLTEPLFYAWRRTIHQRDQEAKRPANARSRQPSGKRAATANHDVQEALPTFVPVTVSLPSPALELVLGQGRVLRVPDGFEPATLRQLLAILEEAPPC